VPSTPSSSSPNPLTIYDVARHAGVSIASVSRVLNGLESPRPETRERVMAAVRELDFVPDGAARALSSRLKEVVGVVFRRPFEQSMAGSGFADEDGSLLFAEVINRGVELAARERGFDLLLSSVDVYEPGRQPRVAAMAGKSDGLIVHDKVLGPEGIIRMAKRVPVVTLVGTPTPASINVRSDNSAGMRELTRHLIADHGVTDIGYIAGHADSPDNIDRAAAIQAQAEDAGIRVRTGAQWQGNYMASGGAGLVERLLADGEALPDVIMCANDQTAIGVLYALAEHGIRVPEDVAVTGFDDIPVARHLRPRLTTVRQPIQQLGATAFEMIYGLISGDRPAEREIVLPTALVRRSSCGCGAETSAAYE
jgi:LacI family transcriptional regulator